MAVSDFITLEKAENIIQAVGFADQKGWTIRDHLEINWEEMETPGRMQEALTTFLNLAGNWLSYHHTPLVYVYVWEVGRIKGIHAHILLHVPEKLRSAFKDHFEGWVSSAGATYDPEDVHMKEPSRYRDGVNRWNGIKGRLRYTLKGIDPTITGVSQEVVRGGIKTGKQGPLGIEPSFQGRIGWKRCGTSQNIGPSARQKAFSSIISGKKHRHPNAANASPQARRTAKPSLIDNDSQLVKDDYHTRDISNPVTAPGH